MYEIFYHELVVARDIPKLSTAWQRRVQAAIELKLMTEPEVYGKPLRRSLKNYRKLLRVGDYRIIFRIQGKLVKILVIQYRSVVYEEVGRREG